jgi:hypothetical protein
MINSPELRYSSSASIVEAKSLVRRCAEPRPSGELVKTTLHRTSVLLGFSFTRTRDIWYGSARRIDAKEMDRLRLEAKNAELAHAVAAVEYLKKGLQDPRFFAVYGMVDSLNAALSAINKDPSTESEMAPVV